MPPDTTYALPAGQQLHEYRIDGVLGTGGFGLTYLATDANLNLRVALKEYLPGDFATRRADLAVEPKADHAESFQWGLQRFMDEARTLASFHHPNIVRVMRFFQTNATGYMVMEFVEGKPLPEWIAGRRPLGRDSVVALAAPLLEGLQVVHRGGYLHRDIKPANVFIRDDGSPVLLDFGSARELKGRDQELTAVVSPGYAPLEQYHVDGRQGPWTDLYALGGVMYWMITGAKPVDATARVRNDPLPPTATKADPLVYGDALLAAVDWALKPNEEERPQSALELLRVITGRDTSIPLVAATQPSADFGNERTVLVSSAPASAPTGPSGLTGMAIDRDLLKKVESDLAGHIGPIAGVVVRKAARTAVTLESLCHVVAAGIADEKARAAFVARYTTQEKSAPVSGKTGLASAPTQAATQSISQKFSQETLTAAENALAQHIGAVARIVVKRAAAKARDETELYLLVSDEIENPADKKAFVRKALSVSGRN
jgi:serine/threonine protein kinase